MTIRAPRTDLIDVLVPAARLRRHAGFARIRRTTRTPLGACSTGEIRYAPAARAVADAVRWAGDDREARTMVAQAVQQGHCPLTLIGEELDAGPVRGSAGLRRVLAEVAGGIRSVAEADFLALITRARLPAPVLNPRLYSGGTLIASPDCWWPEAGVAAEVDFPRVAPRPGRLGTHAGPARPDELLRDHRLALHARADQAGANGRGRDGRGGAQGGPGPSRVAGHRPPRPLTAGRRSAAGRWIRLVLRNEHRPPPGTPPRSSR
jgi:hypothetical protein